MLESGEDITQSEASGAYQMMPKVITGHKSYVDKSTSSFNKGKGESKLLLYAHNSFLSIK